MITLFIISIFTRFTLWSIRLFVALFSKIFNCLIPPTLRANFHAINQWVFSVKSLKMSPVFFDNKQIFNSIIKSIFVYVMNHLVFIKFSTKMFFHHKSVFSNFFITNAKNPISKTINSASSRRGINLNIRIPMPFVSHVMNTAHFFSNRLFGTIICTTNHINGSISINAIK